MIYSIYCHKFPNGKMYFGQTCKKPEQRWGKDGYKYKTQPFIWRAIQKYGWNNIEHTVLHSDLTKEQANYFEQLCISTYRTNEPEYGYNITSGGQGSLGTTMTDENRKKHSERMKIDNPAYHFTDEWRKHISESQIGVDRTTEYQRKVTSERMKTNNPMKDPDVRRKVSETQKGKHLSEETRRKIGEAQKGRKHSEESIRKMREAAIRREAEKRLKKN